jgi:putative mRNA 3-end processing factor
MVKISFKGGTGEVGRNAVLVESKGAKILLDYGVKIGDPPKFPGHLRARALDGIILSHSHLDHSGGLPIFYLSENKPFFATSITSEIVKILITDMIKLNSYYLPFEYLELKNMLLNRRDLKYRQEVKLKDIWFRLLNAGHIPGSAMVDLNINNKKILYTGDFNTINTRLCLAAKTPRKRYDAVIIESTYATHNHPERSCLEKDIISAIEEVVHGGGKVLIPAFAVGRSQEMFCILYSHKFQGKILVDGMARAVNQILLNDSNSIKTPNIFSKAFSKIQEIQGWRDRRRSIKNADVIIAPSGMLQGGTALFYMEKIASKSENAVFLVSFQVPGTGGAKLLETGRLNIKKKEEKVSAKICHFDFSSHSGKNSIQKFLKGLKGKPTIYVMHGEPENCEYLAQWTRDELDLNSVAPKEGDEFVI